MNTPSGFLRNYLNLIDNLRDNSVNDYDNLSLIESDNDRLDLKRQTITSELHQLLVYLKNNKINENKLDQLLSIISTGAGALNEVDGMSPFAPATAPTASPAPTTAAKPTGLALGATSAPDARAIQDQINALKKQQIETQKQFTDQLNALNAQLAKAKQARPM